MGITAVIINGGDILLVKRRNFPFIRNPGVWTFVSGGIKREENSEDAACREILEETGIGRSSLRRVGYAGGVEKFDMRNGRIFSDDFYCLISKTRKVKLNIESSAYRWCRFREIERHESYTNLFADEATITGLIRRALSK